MAPEEFNIGVRDVGNAEAVRLAVPGFVAHTSVFVQADPDNDELIYVGNQASVSSNTGWSLDAGDSIEITINDPAKIWVIAGAGTQKVRFLWA